jgi:hypothetical protein
MATDDEARLTDYSTGGVDLTLIRWTLSLTPAERRLKPNASHLASAGHLNLITRYGPLDLLGTIGSDLGYRELLPHSVELDISAGVRIQVLNLETLIALKEELAGEKDGQCFPFSAAHSKRSIRGDWTYFLTNTARSVSASSPPISPTVPAPINLRTVSLNLNPQIPKP